MIATLRAILMLLASVWLLVEACRTECSKNATRASIQGALLKCIRLGSCASFVRCVDAVPVEKLRPVR